MAETSRADTARKVRIRPTQQIREQGGEISRSKHFTGPGHLGDEPPPVLANRRSLGVFESTRVYDVIGNAHEEEILHVQFDNALPLERRFTNPYRRPER